MLRLLLGPARLLPQLSIEPFGLNIPDEHRSPRALIAVAPRPRAFQIQSAGICDACWRYASQAVAKRTSTFTAVTRAAVTGRSITSSWEAEYRNGRYLDEPPVPFVADILAAAKSQGLGSATGLYVGCGNGRNYLPLVAGGLDLTGLDISPTALSQLTEGGPQRAAHLVCGDPSSLAADLHYPIVIAIQVLQHGNEETTHREVLRARERVAAGGLLCIRVNAVGTEPEYEHDVIERGQDGRFTVRYTSGPKQGLDIHFFSAKELRGLVEEGFSPVLPLRSSVAQRVPPKKGQWVQWEGIWKREPKPVGSALV
jgi:Methyltransferase domain